MKLTSAIIGALSVSALARVLEHAAKRGDVNLIVNVTASFLSEWDELTGKLKEYLKTDTEETQAFDKEKFLEGLNKVSEALPVIDIDSADAAMKEISTFEMSSELSALFETLEGAVTNIDLDTAENVIGQIKNIL